MTSFSQRPDVRRAVFTALALIVASVVAAPSATAATSASAAAEPAPADPLLGTTDLRSDGLNARTLRALDAESRSTGEASAVIALPMSFTPEALLTADEAAGQRAEIIRGQDALIADLERLGAVSTRRYATTPYVAALLPRSALAALSALTSAGEVSVDQVAEVTLAESTVRVQSAMAVAHGFSGAGQTVAVIDTGVDRNHPFLASRVVSEACYSQGGDCPGGFYELTGPGAGVPCTTHAACRHGTHVAGIVAGRHTTGASFDGVAPSATIISINVFSGCGSDCLTTTTSDMMAALDRVYELRDTFAIAAVNMSVGTPNTYSSACDANPLKTAIDNLRGVGIPTVIASGNSSSSTGISSPGCISTAVTVGSTNDAGLADQVSSFSNSASFLDLLAPGASIRSSVPGNGYENLNGTSMAAPHVAGAWALLKQQDSGLTVEEGQERLESTGLPVTDSRNLTNGATKARIRVLGALGITPQPPGKPTNVSATAGVGAASVSFGAPTDTGSAAVSGYIVTIWPGGAQVSGSSSPVAVTDLADDTSYRFSVAARNAAGIGPDSEVSAAVTTQRLPGAPTDAQPGPSDPPGTPATPPVGPGVGDTPGAPPATTTAGPTGPALPRHRSGYWMVGSDGTVHAFGDAQMLGMAPTRSAVDLEPTPSGSGYWVVDTLGRVFAFGDAVSRGNVDGSRLAPGESVTSLSATRSGNGYWIFTTRGRVLTFGDAPFLGDLSGFTLNGPVLDSIATPSGQGYYMVASDGGIFTFGDAVFYGSMGGQHLNAPVQSLVPDADGVGYWLVSSDGGIFTFAADFHGSMGATRLNRPVTGMVRSGGGYLMVGEDGGIFDFSGIPDGFKGSLGSNPPAHPIVSVAVLED